MKIGIACLFFLLTASSWASEFRYHLEMKPEGYHLSMDIDFGRTVTLSQVVFNLGDPSLFPRFNPTMLSSQILNRQTDHYELVTSFKVVGWKAQMLFNCQEKSDAEDFRRQCVLDVPRLNASLFMDSKSDEVSCKQVRDTVHCHFDVAGKIKSVLFLKSEKLTFKAKYQALLNWGKFWYFTEIGNSSVRYASDLFDHSDFEKDIAQLSANTVVRDGKFLLEDDFNP